MMKKQKRIDPNTAPAALVAIAERALLAEFKERPAKRQRCLGAWFSADDEKRARQCCRAAVVFMQQYGKPHIREMRFTTPPGWLDDIHAVHYCHCSLDMLEEAARLMMLPRRPVWRAGDGLHFAYHIQHLNALLRGVRPIPKPKAKPQTNPDPKC